ncbi:Plant disease resistance response protein [Corchorus olitorius]|uniref:Dirigent protein n=1 Tax=Corchorus olitorius TaxID=93759 RepID=A0A1R3H7P4_9ROSI|nr:Plant disease resistance response protein [Corchorus olitorius]
MASHINFSLLLLAVLGISMTIMFSIPVAKADLELKETKISVYFHDHFSNSSTPNATDVIVTGFSGKTWVYNQFGTVFVMDDLVTEGPEPTSPTVGRLQGTYITTSLDGLRIGTSFSLVFTNKAYNGSTIQIVGNVNQLDPVEEYGVASGTGKFRYAKGYAIFEIISFDPATVYTVLRLNASILHY